MRKSRITQNRFLTSKQNSPKNSANDKQMQRIVRHEKLIEMVKKYKRSIQQDERLYRMKKNVEKDIELRYSSTPVNNSYIFPRKQNSQEREVRDDNDEDLSNLSKNIYYDLYTQNVQKIHANVESSSNRRAKSLDQVLLSIKSERIFKKTKVVEANLNNYQILLAQHSNNFIRSNSVRKQQFRHQFVLPLLHRNLQIMKTEETHQPNSVERILKKKLITESNSPLKIKSRRIQTKPTQKYWRKDFQDNNL